MKWLMRKLATALISELNVKGYSVQSKSTVSIVVDVDTVVANEKLRELTFNAATLRRALSKNQA